MSAIEKIRNAVTPSKPEADEFSAALDRLHADEREAETLAQKFGKVTATLEAKERALDKAAYEATTSGNTAAYDKLAAEVDALQDERQRLTRAQNVIADKVAEGRSTLNRLGRAGRLKTFSRHGNAVEKIVATILEHYAAIGKEWEHLFTKVDQIVMAWPEGVPPDGLMLKQQEIASAFAAELYRLVPVHPLTSGRQLPLLPGARMNLLDDVSKQVPLADQFAAAKKAMLALIEHGPAPVVHATEQLAAPASQADVPSGPTIDARSYVPPRRPLNAYLPGGSE